MLNLVVGWDLSSCVMRYKVIWSPSLHITALVICHPETQYKFHWRSKLQTFPRHVREGVRPNSTEDESQKKRQQILRVINRENDHIQCLLSSGLETKALSIMLKQNLRKQPYKFTIVKSYWVLFFWPSKEPNMKKSLVEKSRSRLHDRYADSSSTNSKTEGSRERIEFWTPNDRLLHTLSSNAGRTKLG